MVRVRVRCGGDEHPKPHPTTGPAAETCCGQCGADLGPVDAMIEPGEADRLWVELLAIHLLPLPQALLVVGKVVPERPRLELATAGVAQGSGLAGGVGDELDAEGFDEGARVGGQRRIARIVAGLGELVVLRVVAESDPVGG